MLNKTTPGSLAQLTAKWWRPWAIGVPLSYLVVSLALLWPALSTGGNRLIGYGADSAMHTWFLGWFPFALTHGVNPFITNFATAPHTTNLLWNNADLVLGLLFWPVVQGLGEVGTMNLIYWLVFTAAGSMMAFQLRPYVRHASSAWLGGAFFAFAPWMQSELVAGHLTVLTTATLPLGWWIGRRALVAVKSKRHLIRWGGASGAWVVLQYWAGKELLATTLLMAVCLLGLYYLRHRHWSSAWARQALPLVAAAVVVALLFLAWPLVVQFGSHVSLSQETVVSPKSNVIDLLAYIVPGYSQALSFSFTTGVAGRFTGELLETDLYLGLPLFVLLIWVVRQQWDRTLVRFGLACALVGAIFAAGAWLHVAGTRLELPLPWVIVGHLPGYAKAAPARMAPFVLAGVACLLAAGWDELRERSRPLVQVAIVLLLAITLWPSAGIIQGIRGTATSIPRVISSAALEGLPAGAVVIVLPIPTKENGGNSMDWQSEDNFRFRQPFGYILHPSRNGTYTDNLTSSPLENLLYRLTNEEKITYPLPRGAIAKQMATWKVAAIVDVPYSGFATSRKVLSSLFGQPEMVDGAAVWLQPRLIS